MDATSTIIGVGVAAFLLFFFAFQIDEEKHFLLRLLVIFFALGLLIIIPKVLIDAQHICEVVVANSTDVSMDVRSYEYTSYCFDRTESTPQIFLKTIMWFYRLFMAYVIFFIGYMALMKLKENFKMKGRLP